MNLAQLVQSFVFTCWPIGGDWTLPGSLLFIYEILFNWRAQWVPFFLFRFLFFFIWFIFFMWLRFQVDGLCRWIRTNLAQSNKKIITVPSAIESSLEIETLKLFTGAFSCRFNRQHGDKYHIFTTRMWNAILFFALNSSEIFEFVGLMTSNDSVQCQNIALNIDQFKRFINSI